MIDRATGEVRTAQIFVAVLGASNYTYAEATWTQGLADWIGAHVRAFDVPRRRARARRSRITWRAASPSACRYEPDLNPTYAELASHYGVAVLAGACPSAPRQGQGRGRRAGGRAPGSWPSCAIARSSRWPSSTRRIAARREQLNDRPFKKLPGSRRTALLRPSISPLCGRYPPPPSQFADLEDACGCTSTTTSRSTATTTRCPTRW